MVSSRVGHQTTIEAFAELCGLLSAECSELVCSRVLSLFRHSDEGEPIVQPEAFSSALMAEWGGAVPLEVVEAALVRLSLTEAELESLLQNIRKISADGPLEGLDMNVRVDQALLAVTAAVRSNVSKGEAEVGEAASAVVVGSGWAVESGRNS